MPAKDGLALGISLPVFPVAVLAATAVVLPNAVSPSRRSRLHLRLAALYDIVELASIQPDAPAFRAVVDLDSLPLRHHKIDLSGRTLHHRILRTFISSMFVDHKRCRTPETISSTSSFNEKIASNSPSGRMRYRAVV